MPVQMPSDSPSPGTHVARSPMVIRLASVTRPYLRNRGAQPSDSMGTCRGVSRRHGALWARDCVAVALPTGLPALEQYATRAGAVALATAAVALRAQTRLQSQQLTPRPRPPQRQRHTHATTTAGIKGTMSNKKTSMPYTSCRGSTRAW